MNEIILLVIPKPTKTTHTKISIVMLNHPALKLALDIQESKCTHLGYPHVQGRQVIRVHQAGLKDQGVLVLLSPQ